MWRWHAKQALSQIPEGEKGEFCFDVALYGKMPDHPGMEVQTKPARAKKTAARATLSGVATIARLEARVSPRLKTSLETAAALAGHTVTSFMIQALQEAAESTIERHQRAQLGQEASVRFVETLLSAPAPNTALRAAAARHAHETAA